MAVRWQPVCTVQMGPPRLCVRGRDVTNCSQSVHKHAANTDKSMKSASAQTSTTGAWLLEASAGYFLDLGLAEGLTKLFAGGSVIEFGAGIGCYSGALHQRGVRAVPFEGAANVEQVTHGFVRMAEMTTPHLDVGLPPADWVLCLEVAEHIPQHHEATFLANLDRHNTKGVVMSWSSMRTGAGHVNYQNATYVTAAMTSRGYREDVRAGKALQSAAATFSWFRTKSNRRIGEGGGVRVWRRQHH